MTNMERREAMRGMSIALIGGIFWGLAGVFGQFLFEYKGTNARWLVSVRLVIAGILLLSIVFRLAAVFRLTIPLLYALVVPTLLSDWYYAHYTLANVIWYVLLAVTVLSWVYSLVRKISAIMERRRREKEKEEILIQRVREAGRNGGGIVHIDDLRD